MILKDLLLNLLFPSVCKACHRMVRLTEAGGPFCPDCLASIRLLTGPCCPRCGVPFPSEIALRRSPDHLCGACRTRPPAFDRAVSIGVYEGVMREAVHLFKYRRRTALGRRLMDRLASSLPALPPSDGVLPVPLHPSRLREREFNPALLLARILAGREGVPLFPDLLIRTRPTPPQMALHRRERRKNVRHAFAVNANADVSGLRWLLVDDVLTTGATVNECARILKRNGAAEVTVVTLARVDAPSSSGGKTPEAELGRFKVDRSPDGLV